MWSWKKFIYKQLKSKDVNGRLELVKKYQNGVKVFIDYAHTPDALLKSLTSLQKDYKNNISLVFGCGGERDRKKRPIMAKIADDYCKKIYITDDNPRSENPKKIREELLKCIKKNKVLNIGDRKLAIKKAIQQADPGEIVLIAGKGHEEYQIYKNKILNISDKKIVKKLNVKTKNINKKKQNFIQNRSILSNVLGQMKSVNFNGLSIDTRSIKRDNLFLAIKGEKNDGNKYVYSALNKGAGCILSTSSFKKMIKK